MSRLKSYIDCCTHAMMQGIFILLCLLLRFIPIVSHKEFLACGALAALAGFMPCMQPRYFRISSSHRSVLLTYFELLASPDYNSPKVTQGLSCDGG